MPVPAPSNLSYGKVVWQAVNDIVDGPDPDTHPDFVTPTGTVQFFASILVGRDITALPNPVSVLRTGITGILDDDGYLCTPDPSDPTVAGYRGLELIATDDPDLNPGDWVYNVVYDVFGPDGNKIGLKSHQIYVPTYVEPGDETDLTVVGPVDNAQAIGIPAAEAAAAAAIAAAAAAQASAAAAEAALLDSAEFVGEELSTTGTPAELAVQALIDAGVPPLIAAMLDPVTGDLDALTATVAALSVSGTLTPRGAWDVGTAYNVRDIVTYSSAAWLASTGTTAGEVPGVASAWISMGNTIDATARTRLTTVEANPALLHDTTVTYKMPTGETFDEVTLDSRKGLYKGRFGRTSFFQRLRSNRYEVSPTEMIRGDVYQGVSALKEMTDSHGRKVQTEHTLDSSGNVPTWILNRWKARGAFGTDTRPIRVLVVAGQSNATKRGSTTAVSRSSTNGQILRWDYLTSTIVVEDGTEWVGWGFAEQWCIDHPSERLLIVPASVGSSGFSTTSLSPAPAGYSTFGGGSWTFAADFLAETGQVEPNIYPTLYLDQRVAAARAAAATMTSVATSTIKVIAMIWSQAEADTINMTGSAYQTKQDALFAWVRASLPWGSADLPIIIRSMTPAYIAAATNNRVAIDRVQQDTPARLAYTAYQRGPSDLEENTVSRIHYQPQGQQQSGRILAGRVLARAQQNVTVAEPDVGILPPQRLEARRVGSIVTATWEHPPCRATSLAADYSTDNGATWTAITFPNVMPIGTTVTAAGAVLIRVRSSDGTNQSYYAQIGA